MTNYESHPAADLFPMMEGKAWEEFKEDIRKNGFQQDIVLYKGQILDGRNRYKAAVELSMLDDLPIAEMDDDTKIDPFQWVISRNLHRRHLTESQRASVAAKLVNAKQGDNRFTVDRSIDPSITIDKAAEMLSVGSASVKRAMVVQQHGSPELIAAVERGEVAVSRAAVVAKSTPKEKQVDVARDKPKQQEKTLLQQKTVAEQKLERDIDWVRDFIHSMSRINRLKLLLGELTESEKVIVLDWLKE
jgi:hypothetical protein